MEWKPRTLGDSRPPKPRQNQQLLRRGVSLTLLHRCLFRGFQGVNYKCGSVLFGLISRPSGDLKSLDTVIRAPPDFSRTTSPTLNIVAPPRATGTRDYLRPASLGPHLQQKSLCHSGCIKADARASPNPTRKTAIHRSTSARLGLARSGLRITAWSARLPIGSKADIEAPSPDVRFTPKSGHRGTRTECPLCAKSRLMHCSEQPPSRSTRHQHLSVFQQHLLSTLPRQA
jgi:hypothetical protein